MTFGHQSGPPASARRVAELLRLLQAAGPTGVRDARGPMRFVSAAALGGCNGEPARLIERIEDGLRGADLSW